MGVLSGLEPQEVFHYFEEICSIPHGSYHEGPISDYCMAFAKEHGLQAMQDDLNNIIIKKPATKGYENVPTFIIQGHLDMVCEKEAGCQIDFLKDGLALEVNGDFISAKGTTLGGDDGIAVAYALAVLASDTLAHPGLEVIFTVSEEVGMEGAAAIDLSSLKGKKLLNIDSEEEGILLTSCAGGARINAELPISYEEKTGVIYVILLENLAGGHSGVEIGKGRGNANVLMGRLLLSLVKEVSYFLTEVNGGLKDNAIPRDCQAGILVSKEDCMKLEETIRKYAITIKNEYRLTDPEMTLRVVKKETGNAQVFQKDDQKKLLILMNSLPNGVQTMSMNVHGLVETSLNFGIMKTEKGKCSASYAIRSSVESAKEALSEKMKALIEFTGAKFAVSGNYPGWAFKENSRLREDCVRVYTEMYGEAPKIEAIHAGLECGLLSDKIEGLDCISIGPNMQHIHTTEEQLSISSTKRVWDYIVKVIACK